MVSFARHIAGGRTINLHAKTVVPHDTVAVPRARGRVRLSTKVGQAGTVLQDLHQAGSAKVVFPRPSGCAMQAVMVNTAGGITGGDHFETEFAAGADTSLTLTTQAAERAYGAIGDVAGTLNVTLDVGPRARIEWLPQETILFRGCQFRRHTQINMAPTSQLLFVEPLIFGRAEMGEVLDRATFADRVDVWRDGTPLFLDAMAFDGDVHTQMAGQMAQGAGALASVVFVAPQAAAFLKPVRDILPLMAGASVIGDDLLHIRFLAQDGFALRQSLVPVLNLLTENQLPRVWMI